jgi:hypothetical protein
MSTIVLDPQAADLLKQCQGSAVIRDREGNLLGYFERRLYDPSLIPDFDNAELDRREADFQGIPSAEVRRRLLEELR